MLRLKAVLRPPNYTMLYIKGQLWGPGRAQGLGALRFEALWFGFGGVGLRAGLGCGTVGARVEATTLQLTPQPHKNINAV